ncbi:MAG: GNAT family N-acetyltransferase [Microgenomates group bacterium]
MNTNVHIRKATLTDISIITEMSASLIRSDIRFDPLLTDRWSYGEGGQTYLKKRINGRKGVCLVAEIDGNIVGYATGSLLPIQQWRPVQKTELDNLYIFDEHRSKGIGTQLIQSFLAWSRKMKAKRVILHTKEKNVQAIAFYKRNGFDSYKIILEAVL